MLTYLQTPKKIRNIRITKPWILIRLLVQNQRATNDWLSMFLIQRTMKVVVEGEHSEEVKDESGVPQKTVPGPIQFLCISTILTLY